MKYVIAFLMLISAGVVRGEDADAPKKAVRMLFVTQSGGFKHGSVSRQADQLAPSERAMTELGISSNLFRVDSTQDMAKDFTKDNLANYDLVMFYTTGGKDSLKVDDATWDYFFKEWLPEKGHGFIGAHSATDTLGDYQPYWDMIGGTFDGHPWGSGDTVTISVHDTKHPGSKPWGEEFQIQDEIYWYKNWQPEKVRVLMSLNMAKCGNKQARHVPVAWVKQYGDGRVYYTNLGHNEATWTNPKFLEAMLGGIKWTLGLEEGDATPNPDVSKAQEEKAKADAGK